MQKLMYLLVSQHVSGIIMPIIRRMVQNQQRLWYTALTVLQKTRGEEVVRCALVGIGFTIYLFTFMIQDARSHEIKICCHVFTFIQVLILFAFIITNYILSPLYFVHVTVTIICW
jgi:hypothetical protein